MSRRISVFACALLVAACGSPDPAPDAGTDATIPLDAADDATIPIDAPPGDARADAPATDAPPGDAPEIDGGDPLAALRAGFCEPLARVSCTAPWDCACPGRGTPPPDVETCVSIEAERCIAGASEAFGAHLASGRVRIDEVALASCTMRLEASFERCSTSKEDIRVWCTGFLVETASLGDGCFVSDALCADGAGSCITGECAALPARDASCSEFLLCAGDLVCRDDACVDPSDDGEPCTRDSQCSGELVCGGGACAAALAAIGATCDADGDCVTGARCTGGTCAAGIAGAACDDVTPCASHEDCVAMEGSRCSAQRPVGEPCGDSRDCVDDAFCDFEGIGVCAARRPAGSACRRDDCVRGTFCSSESGAGVCTPVGGEGSFCDAFTTPGTDGCIEGLSCFRGMCIAPPGFGAECADDQECGDGLACRVDIGTREFRCGSPGAAGEACAGFGTRSECSDGLYCDGFSSTCTPRLGAGEGCRFFTNECQPGLDCVGDGPERDGTCRPIPTEGEPCGTTCSTGLSCTYGPIGGSCVPGVCDDIPGGGGPDVEPPRPEPGPGPDPRP